MVSRAGLALALVSACWAQNAVPGKNAFDLRGQRQDVYFFPARGGRPAGTVLYAPGDGGWRGFAVTMAETMSDWGYDVYGIDTKRYLESFTGKTTLTVNDVMSDFATLAGWAGKGGQVAIVGWSEGAGLGLLAGAAEANRKFFSGLVAISLGESSVLGWRAIDNLTYITKREPNEPHFPSLPYLPKVAPLPFVMIHSGHDEYTPAETARKMFAAAGEPKRFWLIPAGNHRFDDGRDAFFQALREGLQWIGKTP
jgi:fermentation-respiration switch protein FrsA (DUF1100 family)